MLSYLPVEVINIIISYIDKGDLSALLAVSLIDRTWCLIGMQYLWKYPFIKMDNKERQANYSKIIKTLLSSLDNETKCFLKINNSFGIPSETAFDYPSFIKQIDFVILHDLIYSWLEQNKFSSHSGNQEIEEIDYEDDNNHLLSYDYKRHNDGFQIYIETLIIFEILFKLIIKKTRRIEILRIVVLNHEFPQTYPYTLIKLEETQKCLSKLKKFQCKGNFLKKQLIVLITGISHEISEFSLSLSNDSEEDLKTRYVSSLLKSQTKIKKLNVRSNEVVTFKYFKGVKKIIRNTIQEIKLFDNDLDYKLRKVLKKCPNLKRICFYNSNLHESQRLENIVFPNLKNLEIINCKFLLSDEPSSSIISFLINNGMNLMKIRLAKQKDTSSNFDINQYARFLFETPKYCSNLVTLSVDITTESELQNFCQVLQNCHSLKNVDFGDNGEWQNFVNKKILYLNKISPSNLRKLKVRYWKVHITKFESFFENYGSFVNEFECPCTEEEVKIKSLVLDLVKKMNRTLIYLSIKEVERQMVSIVKIGLG